MPYQVEERQLEAYCTSCPSGEDVERLVRGQGFILTFEMKEKIRRRVGASIPAQYHFAAPDGTQILYLAGRDVGDAHTRLRPHASRFWVIAGNKRTVTDNIMTLLSAHWGLQWQKRDGPRR